VDVNENHTEVIFTFRFSFFFFYFCSFSFRDAFQLVMEITKRTDSNEEMLLLDREEGRKEERRKQGPKVCFVWGKGRGCQIQLTHILRLHLHIHPIKMRHRHLKREPAQKELPMLSTALHRYAQSRGVTIQERPAISPASFSILAFERFYFPKPVQHDQKQIRKARPT